MYRVIASDRDEGPNAEISYSIEEGDESGKFFIEPKTGLVSSKKFSSAGEYDILTVSVFLVNVQRNWGATVNENNVDAGVTESKYTQNETCLFYLSKCKRRSG